MWILGSTIVKQAFVAARQRPEGVNMGLTDADIIWQGYDGLSPLDVVSKLKTLKKVAETPDLIILHCGGNDLGRLDLKKHFFSYRCHY